MRAILTIVLSAPALAGQTWADDIRPLIEKRCGACHMQGAKMGDYEMNTYAQFMRGGNRGRPVIPGSPDESLSLQMIQGKADPTMPMDGTFLAAGDVETIRKWIASGAKGPAVDEAPARKAGTAPVLKPKRGGVSRAYGAAISEGLIAVAGYREVALVEAATKKRAAVLAGHADAVRNVTFSPDGKRLAAAGGVCATKGEVKIWDVGRRTETATITGHDDCIYGVAFSPDGRMLATSGYDKAIKLWDAETGKEIRTLKDHIDSVYAVAFTPDGKRLVSGAADRTVKIWEVATGKRLYTFSEATDGINSIAVDPTGKMVAAGGLDKSIRVWSMGDTGGELLHSLMAHEDTILRVAWSPDGKRIASAAADRSVKILSASDLTELAHTANLSDWVYGLQFSREGKLLVARMDGSLDLLDMR
jgi:WD40 repeat protein